MEAFASIPPWLDAPVIFHKTAIENVRLGVEKYPHEHYGC